VTLGAFTATYLPWFVEGARMNGVASIPAFFFSGLREMIRYHSGRHGIGFHTDPVQWFAFQRLHVWHTQATPDGQIATMTDIGNPILWWTSAALLVLGLSQLANVHLRGRRAPAVVLWGADSTHFLLLSLITFSMWAPFFFLSRREYQYYMLEAIPFLALCLASFLAVWSRQRIGRWISLGLGLVLVAAFLAYLPFSLALPVPDGYAKALLPQGFFEAPWK
jgi:dolichyl-phosphate-mannose--protein O-mannosyl transferase